MCDVGLKTPFSFILRKREDVQMSDAVNGAFRPAAKSTTVVTGDDRLRFSGRFPADVRRGDHFHHRWIAVLATPSAAKTKVKKTGRFPSPIELPRLITRFRCRTNFEQRLLIGRW